MTITNLISPFFEYDFMQNAGLGAILVALSGPLLGVFLVLRRMSLAADSMAHAVFPGVALGFVLMGLSVPAMSIGGIIAGLLVALITGTVSRTSIVREDACLVSLYVIAVALGVVILSFKNTNIDVMSILFGSILGLDTTSIYMLTSVCFVTLAFLAIFYRPLIIDSLDPSFIRTFSHWGSITHILFLMVVILNLVAGMQTLGTLLSVGAMMLPAVTALIWTKTLPKALALSCAICVVGSIAGLIASYHWNLPAGPAMILACGIIYVFSLLYAVIRPK